MYDWYFFTNIVSYSRIAMGAHFLSDVCVGSIMTLVLIFFLSLLKMIYYKYTTLKRC